MADANFLFSLTHEKLETQTLGGGGGGSVIGNCALWWVWLMQIFHWFRVHLRAWLCLNHLCMDIHAWWPFCTKKCIMVETNFPLVQFSLSLHHCILGSVSPFKRGYTYNISTWTLMHDDLSALYTENCQ